MERQAAAHGSRVGTGCARPQELSRITTATWIPCEGSARDWKRNELELVQPCKGEDKPQEPPSPSGPDARSGPGARAAEDAGSADATIDTTIDSGDDAADAALDAAEDAPSDALVVTDAAADGSTGLAVRKPSVPKKPKVDKVEHRKGMPVRDNLLE